MGLEEDFKAAADEAGKIATAPGITNDEKLEMYSLFKQASEGDCSTDRPGIFDQKGRAKWDAWTAKKGMSKEEAMQKYIEIIKTLKAKYNV